MIKKITAPKWQGTPQDMVYNICVDFINKNQIGCSETIYQSDRVIENSLPLIEQICNAIGYYKFTDEDE